MFGSTVSFVAEVPGKRLLVCPLRGGLIQMRDFKGALLFELKGHSEPMNWVSWNEKGTNFLSGSNDKTARMWSGDGKCHNLYFASGKIYGIVSSILNG